MDTIKVAINRRHRGKYPQGWPEMSERARRGWWRVFNGQFSNEELTPQELAAAIGAGYAYTSQHEGYRKADNFICAQHLALDFDTEDERSTLAYLASDPFIRKYAAFLHTTPSHTPDKPRARAVFILDRPVHDAGEYALFAESLVHRFGAADKSCKDAARFFFGAEGCRVQWLGAVLTLEDAAAELVKPYQRQTQRQTQRKTVSKRRKVVQAGDVPAKILESHSEWLLYKVKTAPDGAKYPTLRDISIAFGGYVAGGYYSFSEARRWLEDAIKDNPNNVKSLRHAFDTIEDSLKYGMQRPLAFELRDNDPVPVPDDTPAIDKSWRETAVSGAIAELEALIMEMPSGDPAWSEAAIMYTRVKGGTHRHPIYTENKNIGTRCPTDLPGGRATITAYDPLTGQYQTASGLWWEFHEGVLLTPGLQVPHKTAVLV